MCRAYVCFHVGVCLYMCVTEPFSPQPRICVTFRREDLGRDRLKGIREERLMLMMPMDVLYKSLS